MGSFSTGLAIFLSPPAAAGEEAEETVEVERSPAMEWIERGRGRWRDLAGKRGVRWRGLRKEEEDGEKLEMVEEAIFGFWGGG